MEGGDLILQDFDSVKIRLFTLKSKKNPFFWNMRIISYSHMPIRNMRFLIGKAIFQLSQLFSQLKDDLQILLMRTMS